MMIHWKELSAERLDWLPPLLVSLDSPFVIEQPDELRDLALYFVDADGVIRDNHFGEGRYEQSERVIQQLLGVERDLVLVDGSGVEAAADWDRLRTPETYLGYARSSSFMSSARPALDQSHVYGLPDRLRFNHWALGGEWTIGREKPCSIRPAAASPTDSMRATRISCCHLDRANGFPSACSSTVHPPARHTGSMSTRTAAACFGTHVSTNSSGRSTR